MSDGLHMPDMGSNKIQSSHRSTSHILVLLWLKLSELCSSTSEHTVE